MSCNQNCNQGRTCDCGSKETNNAVFIASIVVCVLAYVVIGWGIIKYTSKNVTVNYDCRLAEIAVDYPAKVKEECRKKLNGWL